MTSSTRRKRATVLSERPHAYPNWFDGLCGLGVRLFERCGVRRNRRRRWRDEPIGHDDDERKRRERRLDSHERRGWQRWHGDVQPQRSHVRRARAELRAWKGAVSRRRMLGRLRADPRVRHGAQLRQLHERILCRVRRTHRRVPLRVADSHVLGTAVHLCRALLLRHAIRRLRRQHGPRRRQLRLPNLLSSSSVAVLYGHR